MQTLEVKEEGQEEGLEDDWCQEEERRPIITKK